MIFYSDLVKKVKEGKLENMKESYVFRLNLLKTLSTILMGLPFVLLGVLEVITMKNTGFKWQSLLSIAAFAYGVFLMTTVLNFKIVVKNNSLTLKKKNINFDDIEICTLENIIVPKGKKVEPALKVLTKNNEEIYFHLFMGNRVLFLLLIKEILGSRFKIVEEK